MPHPPEGFQEPLAEDRSSTFARPTNDSTPSNVATATAYGSTREGWSVNSTDPQNGPRIRPSEAKDWLTPRTSPWFAGSARREISEETDGLTNANPHTDKPAAR